MSDTQWTDVAAMAEVPEGDVVGMMVAGRDLALYNVSGEIFATDNRCSHGHARLCDGFVEGHEIECPMHQGRFDIRTGQPTCAPATDAIQSYPAKIEGGRILLAIG